MGLAAQVAGLDKGKKRKKRAWEKTGERQGRAGQTL